MLNEELVYQFWAGASKSFNPVLVLFAELGFYALATVKRRTCEWGKPNALKSLPVIDFCRRGWDF